MKASHLLALLLGLLCLLPLAQGTARAQGPQGAPTVSDVAEELYCPLCSGLTVDVCELEVCVDMRAIIADKLAAGESPEQIQAFFVEQYGQQVLGKPSTRGFDLTAWIMPFLALLLAAVGLGAWLRGRPRAVPSPALAPAPPDEWEARLERELRRLEEG